MCIVFDSFDSYLNKFSDEKIIFLLSAPSHFSNYCNLFTLYYTFLLQKLMEKFSDVENLKIKTEDNAKTMKVAVKIGKKFNLWF